MEGALNNELRNFFPLKINGHGDVFIKLRYLFVERKELS